VLKRGVCTCGVCHGVCGWGSERGLYCAVHSLFQRQRDVLQSHLDTALLFSLLARVVCSVRESGQQHIVHNAFKMRSAGAKCAVCDLEQ
jgi:hypothetical protein